MNSWVVFLSLKKNNKNKKKKKRIMGTYLELNITLSVNYHVFLHITLLHKISRWVFVVFFS